MNPTLDKLFWHDGLLVEIGFSIGGKGKTTARIPTGFVVAETAGFRFRVVVSLAPGDHIDNRLYCIETHCRSLAADRESRLMAITPWRWNWLVDMQQMHAGQILRI